MGSARPVYENLTVGPQEEAEPPPEATGALLNVAEEHPLPETDLLAHKVPITDMEPIPAGQLEEAVRWIDAHIGTCHIYLFCNAGVGRSPSVAVAYLCCYEGFSFGDAVKHVVRRKPDISTLPRLIERIETVRARLGRDEESGGAGT
jgi:protein-tyrosine phosphatase